MNQNEYYYRRTVRAIGNSLLIWSALIAIFDLFVLLWLPSLLELFFANAPAAAIVVGQILYGVLYAACFMIPVIFLRFFIKRDGYSYQPMYSEPHISPWLPLIILSGVAIVFAASELNSFLMELIGYDLSVLASEEQVVSSEPRGYELILEFFVICLVPGFCEEFLFRGAILSNCLPFGKGKAIVISALLFSLMHRNAAQILYTFVGGILLGVIYVKTKSIWNCILLHTVNNFVSCTQGVMQSHIKDIILAITWIEVLEILLFIAGVFSTVILIFRFFSQRNTSVKEGFFEGQLPEGEEYAPCPISAERARRLFMAPSMTVYLALCVLQILLLVVIIVGGGLLIEIFG